MLVAVLFTVGVGMLLMGAHAEDRGLAVGRGYVRFFGQDLGVSGMTQGVNKGPLFSDGHIGRVSGGGVFGGVGHSFSSRAALCLIFSLLVSGRRDGGSLGPL